MSITVEFSKDIADNEIMTWKINGVIHKEDGPAIICENGYQEWYLYDQLHRLDGPAIIHPQGYNEWYYNGKLHRMDGTALDHPHVKKWYIHGTELTEQQFNKFILTII